MSDFGDLVFDVDKKDDELSYCQTDYERAEYLQKIVVCASTSDGPANNNHYQYLRKYFLSKEDTKELVPDWIRTNRDLGQFWQFIKYKFSTYAERRKFIWSEFNKLLGFLETINTIPHVDIVSQELKNLNSDYIMTTWKKALERKDSDPEGAITTSRTLLESVLKYILDDLGISYSNDLDIHELYKIVSNEINLSPEQHNEKLFKQILGGCSGIISGLGSLRNSYGDAHGKGKVVYQPSERHAELAVNLSGTLCLFLMKTYEYNKKK